MEISLNDNPAMHPVPFWRNVSSIGNLGTQYLDITQRRQLVGLCNRFCKPSGGNPAYGYFAMNRFGLNKLKDVDIELVMSVNDAEIVQGGLRMVRATGVAPVVPGKKSDGDAFVIEVADKRFYGNHPHVSGDTSAQKIFNIPAPLYGKDQYYTESLDPSLGPGLEVPWDWQGMLDEIWPSWLGASPTLSTANVFATNPVGFDFRGMSPYQAVQVILGSLMLELKLNSDGSFDAINSGVEDSFSRANDRLRTKYASAIDESVEWVEPVSSYIPKGVKVHFHKTATNSGSENVFTKDDGQWFADLEHVITINASATQASSQSSKLVADFYHQIWDDSPAWTDPYSGVIENLTDLQARAQDVADRYYGNILAGKSRFHEVYSWLIDFNVCGLLQGISWAQCIDRGGAWVTEIFAHPRMQAAFSGGRLVPEWIRPRSPWQWKAAPVYPPDTMLWRNDGLLTSGSSTSTQDDLYNGTERRYNPATRSFVDGIYVKGVPAS